MKGKRLLVTALVMPPVGWSLFFWGMLSQLGDPAPTADFNQLYIWRGIGYAGAACGVLLLFGASWLSGRLYAQSQQVAMLVVILVIVPFIGFCALSLS